MFLMCVALAGLLIAGILAAFIFHCINHQKIPVGTIIAWNGKGKLPDGWLVCDGNNNTPDLTGRVFLAGYNYSSGTNNEIAVIAEQKYAAHSTFKKATTSDKYEFCKHEHGSCEKNNKLNVSAEVFVKPNQNEPVYPKHYKIVWIIKTK
ncbi:uncharacterized protein LOC111697937 isoform X2 [Eurytemora carolleeae]|uniref:uncharacterized protein LOC111697937 isoform X2 n=1 Tax=Eurytemora carolleeae TaxID=1294199 RepID=UPI000C77F749|nr:uncharacterized protein LOC111697937 isoform X2 [Eurytemora carolleeae]|eukprot:XP_023323878.1 uncharacterized protein LOC111697937 isoform X2 [Eurytemora affinis]